MPPVEFSHYRVISLLGKGGMGEVYLAQDLSLDRKVAVKFLLRVEDDDAAPARLLREARAAAHLDHPFICKVYEVSEHDGQPFLAMEYVEGLTLKEKLERGAARMPDALQIGIEVAEALNFAHTRGIVHRDLKPANVMMAADGHVKVMDFGIAKRLGAAVAGDAPTVGTATAAAETVSLPGGMTGTLEYMSPEQVRGEPVDARSDVFAFGVLMYELLTGKQPFARGSIFDTAHAILNDTPPSIETLVDGSPALSRLVSRCLEQDRERRYQSLGDVRLDLEALRVSPVQPPVPARHSKRWLAAAIVGALLLIAGAITQWVKPMQFLKTERVLAFKERDWILIADFNNLTKDPVFDNSLRLALQVDLAQSPYVNIYPADRIAATLQRMKRQPTERLDETLASEVAVRESVRGVLACDIAQLGNVYSLTARLIDPVTRMPVLTDSVQAHGKDKVLDALGSLVSHVRSRLGESLGSLSQQSRPLPQVTTSSLEALKMYAEALKGGPGGRDNGDALLRQAIALDPDFALAHAELGRRYYMASGKEAREEAERHFVKALALTDRLTLRERLWIQASAEDSRGNRDRAVDAYEAYLQHYPDDVRALFRVSWTRMATLEDFEGASKGFERLVALQPRDASSWVNLASSYSGKGDYERAVATYQKAFALDPAQQFGVFVNHEYGFTLVRLGKLSEAASVFERMKKEAEPESNRGRGFRSLGLLEMYRGRYGSAIDQLRQAVVIDQTYSISVSEFRDRLFLATAFEGKGRAAEADAEWTAIDKLISRLSLSPDWLTHPIQLRARQGRVADAQRWFKQMRKTTGSATADASIARNTGLDRANVDLAEGEIERASGHAQRAVALLEPVRLVLKSAQALEALAAAYLAADRLDEAVKLYEELMAAPPVGNEEQEFWLRGHLALGQLYERTNRYSDARRIYSTLIDRWKDGDSDLPLLKAVRSRLEHLPSVAAPPAAK